MSFDLGEEKTFLVDFRMEISNQNIMKKLVKNVFLIENQSPHIGQPL